MTHAELVKSLAETYFDLGRWLVYTESRLGSHYMQQDLPIPDVFAIKKSYTQMEMRTYEVKASNSDFQSDVRTLKFEKYMQHSDRVFFALGPNVTCDYEEILKHHKVGIIKFYPKSGIWRVVRQAPKLTRQPLDEWVFLSLMMNGKLVRFDDRLSRLEREAVNLKKLEIDGYGRTLNESLKKRFEELRDQEYRVKNTEQDVKDRVRKEVMKLLNLGYISDLSKLPEEIFVSTIMRHIGLAQNEIREKLKTILEKDLLEWENKTQP